MEHDGVADGELVAGFGPGPARWVLVLAFDELEEAILTQERVTSQLCGWADDGARFDRVETVALAEAQPGRRDLFGGEVVVLAQVTTRAALEEAERARKAWAERQMQKVGLRGGALRLSESWSPSPEQMDYFDKWVAEAVDLDPAGVELGQRRLTGAVRNGFNVFVKDHGRPDLQMLGSPGGRALSALLQSRFRGDVEVRRGSSNNKYYHGLRRKEGSNAAWFPG